MSQMECREGEFEEASNQLTEGLKSCRSIVDSYRTMLGINHGDAEATDGIPAADNNE